MKKSQRERAATAFVGSKKAIRRREFKQREVERKVKQRMYNRYLERMGLLEKETSLEGLIGVKKSPEIRS